MGIERLGEIVWHDLFVADTGHATGFYARVAGWTFEIERATDFVWGGGPQDYALAQVQGEAGAGVVQAPARMAGGWVPYVEVPDVDGAVARAEALGGTVVRAPFDVPGVGRNALVCDPLGAMIGVSVSAHDFPVPRRQFGVEAYLPGARTFPDRFYADLLEWRVDAAQAGGPVTGPSGRGVAVVLPDQSRRDAPALWLPRIRVADPEAAWQAAEALGAERMTDGPTTPEHGVSIRALDGACMLLCKDGDT